MSAVNATPKQVPLVLCCADDGEVALVGVLDELHRKGHAPEVVMGVESEAGALTAAVDRIRGPALFVLCQSEDLDRTQVRRLSGLFSARRGPEHQLLTVQLEAGNPMAMLPQIEAAVDAVSAAGPMLGGDDDGYHMRDVIVPTGVSALRREAADPRRPPAGAEAERIARELHEEMVAAEAVLTRRKAEREFMPPPVGQPAAGRRRPATPRRPPSGRAPGAAPPSAASTAAAGAAVPPLREPVDDLIAAETAPLDPTSATADAGITGVPNVIDDDRAVVGAGPAAGRAAGSARVIVEQEVTREPSVVDPRREEDERPIVDARMSPAAAAAVAAARDRAMADEVLERTDKLDTPLPPIPDEPPPTRSSGPMGKLLLLLSGAGMAALIGLAITSLNSESPPSTGRGSPAATAKASGADGGAKPAGQAGPSAGVAASAGDSKAAPKDPAKDPAKDPSPDPRADAGGESGASADGASGADAGGDGATDPAAGSDGGKPVAGSGESAGHATPPSPPSTDLPGPVAQAVADGRVKVHGKILFLAAPRETMTWDEADRRCRQRKIAGLGGWRLPSKGQLGRLRRGGFATSGSFWTRQVVGGDEVYAFDAKSAKSSLWLKVEPNGRSLCVRRVP